MEARRMEARPKLIEELSRSERDSPGIHERDIWLGTLITRSTSD